MGDITEEGVEYLAIDRGNVVAETGGLGAVAVVPLIVDFVAHQMICTVEVHNLTDIDFTWDVLDQVHGEASVMPKDQSDRTIPKTDHNVDHWGDRTTVQCAYFAGFAFINSTDLSAIGVVLGLTPSVTASGRPRLQAEDRRRLHRHGHRTRRLHGGRRLGYTNNNTEVIDVYLDGSSNPATIAVTAEPT